MKPKSWMGAGLVVLALACSKEGPPTAEPPGRPTSGATAAATGAGPASGKASYQEESFALSVRPTGPYRAGQAATVQIELEAKGPYKVNDKYPHKLKLADAPGLLFPEKVVGKEHLALELKKAVLTVGFTPEAAGKRTVSGTFHFSVCSEQNCLMEQRALALEIDVQ